MKPTNRAPNNPRSLLKRILGSFGIILVFIFFSAYTSFRNAQRATLAAKWADHTYDVLWHLDHFYSALQAATSHQRGYLLTKQPSFLTSYRRSATAAERRLDQLGVLISDNPTQKTNLALLKQEMAIYLKTTNAIILTQSAHNLSEAHLSRALRKEFHSISDIRTTIAKMEEEEKNLLISRLDTEENRARKLMQSIFIETILALLFLSFSLWIIYRQIILSQRLQNEKERLGDEVISMMTHELRNPLTVMYSALTALLEYISKEESPQGHHFLDMAIKSSRRMQRLVEDFLEIQKLEYGELKFNLKTVTLSSLVKESLESAKIYATQAGVNLTLAEDLPEALVNVDEDRLTQVMANLISNAIKHSPHQASVEIRISRQGSLLRTSVSDHGPGVPKAFRERLFQKFAKGNDAIEKNGTGLGLSISKALIEKMGGKIALKEDAQEGATFYFDLPEILGTNTINHPRH